MDPLKDTQSEKDLRRIGIDRVGVRGLRYPVMVNRRDGGPLASVAECALWADLPPAVRGTHMSRFIEALEEFRSDLSSAQVIELARSIRNRLKASAAGADLSFTWFIEKAAPVSGKVGLLDCTVRWKAEARGRKSALVTEVSVPVGTVCPCSKAISERGAHNQRGMVTISAEGSAALAPEDLIAIAEASASCDLFSLLKRSDEKFVTERAYDNPVFVEDVVRSAAERLKAHREIRAWKVSAENFESIHSHNAWAEISGGL